MCMYIAATFSARGLREHALNPAAVGLGMHLLIWFSPSVPVNGAALSIVVLFYGPIWPATFNWDNDMLPQEVRMVTMAIMYVSLPAIDR